MTAAPRNGLDAADCDTAAAHVLTQPQGHTSSRRSRLQSRWQPSKHHLSTAGGCSAVQALLGNPRLATGPSTTSSPAQHTLVSVQGHVCAWGGGAQAQLTKTGAPTRTSIRSHEQAGCTSISMRTCHSLNCTRSGSLTAEQHSAAAQRLVPAAAAADAAPVAATTAAATECVFRR